MLKSGISFLIKFFWLSLFILVPITAAGDREIQKADLFVDSIPDTEDAESILVSGVKPLLVKVYREDSQSIRIRSKLIPHLELIAKKGSSEVLIPYDSLEFILSEDILSFYEMDSDGKDGKLLRARKILPVRVRLFVNHPKDAGISLTYKPEAIAKEKSAIFTAKVSPWKPSLKGRLFLAPVQSLGGKISYSVEPAVLKQESSKCVLNAVTPETAMGALAVMIGEQDWIECGERLRVYVHVTGTSFRLPSPSADELAKIDGVIDEIFPLPRDQKQITGIQALRSIISKSFPQGLEKVLRLLKEDDRKFLLNDAQQDPESVLMDLSLIYLTHIAETPKEIK